MFDPYARDTPGMADPASTLYLITPDDVDGIPRGVKALRIWNPTGGVANLRITTASGEMIDLPIPPECLLVEPVRVSKVHAAGTTADLVIHGYTDAR